MGLEDIITNIESDTKLKVKQILDQAGSEAEKIRSDATESAQANFASAKAKAEGEARQIIMRETSRANIEANGIYQDAVNKAINKSVEQIEDNLVSYLNGDSYTRLLNKLAKSATDELGQGCTLYVREEDKERISGPGLKLEVDPEMIGGLKAESADGKMSVNYSIEKILDGITGNIAVKLMKHIQE